MTGQFCFAIIGQNSLAIYTDKTLWPRAKLILRSKVSGESQIKVKNI